MSADRVAPWWLAKWHCAKQSLGKEEAM